MPRTGDAALPALSPPGGHTFTKTAERLHIALERLPGSAYTWDDTDPDVTWDDTTPERVWDAPFIGSGFTHATCDFVACRIDSGHPDAAGLFGPSEAVVTLANPTGAYSTRSVDGRLVYSTLGRRVQILGEADSQSWWLFSGRVTAWDENPDGTVTITAHDGFAQLSQEVATPWTPGTANQTAAQRITAICAQWGYVGATNLAPTVDLFANPPTDRSPLEEIQVTALSDGGAVFCDADGRLTYRDRGFTVGRSDQTVIHTFSDNYCTGPLIVWNLELLTDDVGVASQVRLENWETPPKTAVATATVGPWDIPYVWTHPDPDLWTVQADGNRLAGDMLARHTNDTVRFGFALHLLDPVQDLWRAAIDLRIGDVINVVRTFPAADGTGWLDVSNLVTAITHEVTPDAWVTTVGTSRVVAYTQPDLWDASPYTWDDTDPANAWSY